MTRHGARHPEAQTGQDVRDLVGANIEIARVQAGLTNRVLAGEVGIDVRLLQKHKAGDSQPSAANLLKYARALRKPVGWFFEPHDAEAAA